MWLRSSMPAANEHQQRSAEGQPLPFPGSHRSSSPAARPSAARAPSPSRPGTDSGRRHCHSRPHMPASSKDARRRIRGAQRPEWGRRRIKLNETVCFFHQKLLIPHPFSQYFLHILRGEAAHALPGAGLHLPHSTSGHFPAVRRPPAAPGRSASLRTQPAGGGPPVPGLFSSAVRAWRAVLVAPGGPGQRRSPAPT